MDLMTEMTVSKLTPPGYFNLASDAPATHKAYITWWDAILTGRAAQAVALKSLILTPWLVSHLDYPRTPWLAYLLKQYGVGFFGGTNNQAAALYKLVSNGWNRSTIKNVLLVIQTLCLAPFSWYDSTLVPQIMTGNLLPSVTDTGFIIYSTAGSAPATPGPTTYAARSWVTPAGWTNTAASATFYSRGYISGATLVWCAPRPVSDFANPYVFSASVPLAVASAGTICIVASDGTGDSGTVYYSDGSAWRKSSYTNIDLGLIVPLEARPVPEAITVLAPNPASVSYAIDSQQPPPAAGPTAGYGTFSTWSATAIMANEITIRLHQLAGGSIAVATLFELLRRIIPTGKTFVVDIDGTKYNITDTRQT
jgi:hypothetical protein